MCTFFNLFDINIKPLSNMSKRELWKYEQKLSSEFDNPFLDEENLDVLIDKYAIFNRDVDEDYNYRKVPKFWLRGCLSCFY